MMSLLLMGTLIYIQAQDWSGIPVPADAGEGMEWELQENVSDDFYKHRLCREK